MLLSAENNLGLYCHDNIFDTDDLLAIFVPGNFSRQVEHIGDSVDAISLCNTFTFSLTHLSFSEGIGLPLGL